MSHCPSRNLDGTEAFKGQVGFLCFCLPAGGTIIPVGPDELGGKSQDGEDDLSSMGKKLSPGFCFLLGLGCHIWKVLNLYHLHNKNQRYDSTQAQNFK